MEKKYYCVPEIEVINVTEDIITGSYTEGEEWTAPELFGDGVPD